MNKILGIMLLGMLVNCSLLAQSKYSLNVEQNCQTSEVNDNHLVSGSTFEFSMMKGGYFTMGTVNSLSDKMADKNVPLLYGHPFSYTSFPYIIIAGEKYHLDNYFRKGIQQMEDGKDYIVYQAKSNELNIEFQLKLINGGNTLQFNYKVVNVSGYEQQIGLGLFFDPEIGNAGDGHAFVNSQFITTDSIFTSGIPDTFFIYERNTSPNGLGYNLDWNNNRPKRISIGNWDDLYYESSKFMDQAIFDLSFDLSWGVDSILAGDSMEIMLNVNLDNSKLSSGLFMRWDMPSFLIISDQKLYPNNIKSSVELINESVSNLKDLSIKVVETGPFLKWESAETFDLSAKNAISEHAFIKCMDSYQDEVIPLKIQLLDKSNNIVDEIIRNVYVPAAPFSDSGLIVYIDSLILGNFPQVEVEFHAENEVNGQLIYQFSKYNLSFTEDSINFEKDSFSLEKNTSGGVNEADIIFVLDVTGSMGNEIDQVKAHINEFADSLERYGIDYSLGMVTFLDIIENVYDFTNDISKFYDYIALQSAHGGGDGPENSLDALKKATEFSFRPSAKRIIVWITDAPFHIQNSNTPLSIMDVVNLTLTNGITVYAVGPESYQTDYFDQIVLNTNGKFFDINGNFRDVLMEVSRMQTSGKYMLKYNSPAAFNKLHKGVIEIHYAGLGGKGEFSYKVTRGGGVGLDKKSSTSPVKISPNPVTNYLTIELPGNSVLKGELIIFNLDGKRLYQTDKLNQQMSIDKHDFSSAEQGSMYILKIILYDEDSKSEIFVTPFVVKK